MRSWRVVLIKDDTQPKVIPENAVQEEQAKTDSLSGAMAGKEKKAFSKASLKSKLKDSRDKTSILIEDVYRWGILFLFIVGCLAVLYFAFQLTCLISAHVDNVKSSPAALEELLRDIWKVLSGSAVVIFVQFLGWAIKNRRDGASQHTISEDD